MSARSGNPKVGQYWQSVLDEEVIKVVRVDEVTVDYCVLGASAARSSMLNVFTALYEPAQPRAQGAR